jgi:hypothetical protein
MIRLGRLEKSVPQGLKPSSVRAFMARLNPCPSCKDGCRSLHSPHQFGLNAARLKPAFVTSIDGCAEASASTFLGFVLKWNAVRAQVG